MSSTNKTPHYDLSQFLAGDKASWIADINPDMLKIDTALFDIKTDATDAASNASAAQQQSQAANENAQLAQQEAEQAMEEVTKLQTKVSAIETDYTGLSGQVTTIQSALNVAESDITQLQTDVESAQTTANAAQSAAGNAMSTATSAINVINQYPALFQNAQIVHYSSKPEGIQANVINFNGIWMKYNNSVGIIVFAPFYFTISRSEVGMSQSFRIFHIATGLSFPETMITRVGRLYNITTGQQVEGILLQIRSEPGISGGFGCYMKNETSAAITIPAATYIVLS